MVKNIILTSANGEKNLKGILTLENTKNNTLVNLKTYNLLGFNKLILGIKAGGELYKVELTDEENYLIEKNLNLNEKISAVVLNVENQKTEILIWGSNETNRVWKNSILYDLDLNDNEDDEKTNLVTESEKVKTNNMVNNFMANDDYETDEEIETIVDNAFESEPLEDENTTEENKNNKSDFLSSIENQVEELLNSYEEEKALENLIPNSKFVKVNSSGDNFYIFGVIYENNEIKYIVYGLPGEFSVKPDDEYTNYYQWLPLNPENPEGYGYYLMYQDASTGNQIEVMFD